MVVCPFAQHSTWCVHTRTRYKAGGCKVKCKYKEVKDCPFIINHKQGQYIIKVCSDPLKMIVDTKSKGHTDIDNTPKK